MKNKVLFIVGASRSGTKLVRDLLNNHSLIALPNIESQFLIDYFHNYSGSKQRTRKFLLGSKFVKRIGKSEIEHWLESLDLDSYKNSLDIVVDLLKRAADDYDQRMYWGDKTPFYLRNIEIIKKYLPEAKFIHILRDPRDRCLSVNRTWGKNLYRAAHGWYADISACREQAKSFSDDYLELYYEDLIQNTSYELHRCCEFLSLNFEEDMDKLNKPTEQHGATSKEAKILSANSNKTLDSLGKHQVQRMEEIVYPLFSTTKYSPFFAKGFVPYSKFWNNIYKFVDFVNFKYSVYKKNY